MGQRVLTAGGDHRAWQCWNLKPSPSPLQVSRFTITLPPGQQLAGLDNGPAVALSPDGTHLAYVATEGGTQQLYLRAIDSLEARRVPGTERAVNPFFSPDGQWLGFFGGGKLKKVSVSGGAAVTLSDAAFPHGASWGSRGMIAYAPTSVGALQLVSDAGGVPQPLTRLAKGGAPAPSAGRSSCPVASQCSLLPQRISLTGPVRRSQLSRLGRANIGIWSKGRLRDRVMRPQVTWFMHKLEP